ncbi:MAG: Fe-S protein assembly co-chaperone HscB [Chitinophagaceae bacterium]|nr:Fe-S protein assembly co-chaperone HscB [Chitinophagaceae bacterium]
MTYFELFEIPVQLKVNTSVLAQQFFALSRKYHPDYFATEDPAAQAEALEKSALLNKAWKTFQNPDETINYVLRLKGLLQEEEKYELPAGFLMEVLDINESLMDVDETTIPQLESRISELQTEIYEPVKKCIEDYRDDSVTEKELLQVKEYYYKKKYLDRIRRQLAGMA